jgi:hypothetical protein
VTDRADNRDALHGRTRPLALPLALLAAALPEAPDENGYRRMWTRYETKARAALDTRLEAETALFEPKAAWLLARHLPAQTWLTVAGSMPVRDLEYVAPPGDSALGRAPVAGPTASTARSRRPWAWRMARGIRRCCSRAISRFSTTATVCCCIRGNCAAR